jgi:hypothetical protein
MILRELVNIIGWEIDEAEFQRITAQTDAMFEKMKKAGQEMSLKVTAPIMGMAGLAIKEFTDWNVAMATVRQTLISTGNQAGYTAEGLDEMAASLRKGTDFGKTNILSGVIGSLLMFDNISRPVFTRASALAIDLAARMKIDLASAGMKLGRMLENPAESLNSLRMAGIKFNKEQQKLVQNMVDTGRTAEAQDYILTHLETHGLKGAARAMAEAGSGFKAMKIQLLDTMESYGKILFPYFKKFNSLLSSVLKWFENLQPSAKKTIIILAGFAAAIGPVLYMLGTIMPKILAGVNIASKAFSVLSVGMSAAAAGGIAGMTAAFIEVLGVLALVVAGILIFEDVVAFMSGEKSLIGELATDVGVWLDILEAKIKKSDIWQGFLDNMRKLMDVDAKFREWEYAMLDKLKFFTDSFKDGVKAMFDGIKKMFGDFGSWATSFLSGHPILSAIVKTLVEPALAKPEDYKNPQSFFYDAHGQMEKDVASGLIPSAATTAASSKTQNLNVNVTAPVTVPAGTTDVQQAYLKNYVEKYTGVVINDYIRHAIFNAPEQQ